MVLTTSCENQSCSSVLHRLKPCPRAVSEDRQESRGHSLSSLENTSATTSDCNTSFDTCRLSYLPQRFFVEWGIFCRVRNGGKVPRTPQICPKSDLFSPFRKLRKFLLLIDFYGVPFLSERRRERSDMYPNPEIGAPNKGNFGGEL